MWRMANRLKSLGIRVKELRERAGMSQLALAESAGTTSTTISAIETGRSAASWELLDDVAGALGMPLPALLGDAPVTPRPPATRASLIGEIVGVLPALDENQLRVVLDCAVAAREGFSLEGALVQAAKKKR
jgi:transcriptional regulator with XRE-family HTH domain